MYGWDGAVGTIAIQVEMFNSGPTNDQFADGAQLPVSGTVPGLPSTEYATVQVSEPDPLAFPRTLFPARDTVFRTYTVWYRYTAPPATSGSFRVSVRMWWCS